MNNVFKNLQVNPEKMLDNLEKSKGLPMAEAVMTKLIEKGMGRGDAHELVRKCSLKASDKDKDLLTTLLEDKNVSKLLGKNVLEEIMNPS